MRLCLSTLFVHESTIGKILRSMRELDVGCWEIIDEKPNELDERMINEYILLMKLKGLCFNIHSPYNPIAYGDAWFERLVRTIRLSAPLRPRGLVLHLPKERGLEYAVESVERLSSTASKYGVSVLVENCTFSESLYFNSVEDFEYLFSTCSDKNVGMCLDVGHASIMGELEIYIKNFLDKVRNVHMHDNDGRRDLHLRLGSGVVPWSRVIAKLLDVGYEGFVTLESKEGIAESLDAIMRRMGSQAPGFYRDGC